MKRNDAEQIGDMIRKFFRLNGLESPLNEYRLVQAWKDMVGPLLPVIQATFILKIRFFMYTSLLPCSVEADDGRDLLVRNLNKQVGAQVIVNIIFR